METKVIQKEQVGDFKMAKAFVSQTLIGCQISPHGDMARSRPPNQWRAYLARPNSKSLFSSENRSKLMGWSLAGALALGLSLAGWCHHLLHFRQFCSFLSFLFPCFVSLFPVILLSFEERAIGSSARQADDIYNLNQEVMGG